MIRLLRLPTHLLTCLLPLHLGLAEVTVLDDLGAPGTAGSRLFEEIAAAKTGVAFTNPIDNTHPLRRLYISGFASSGVAVGDVDGDGLPDLYLTRGPGDNVLYRQTAPFQFEDITAKAGVGMPDTWSTGAAMADVNGDGHLDLYVCAYDSPNALFLNNGKGGFTDAASQAKVQVKDASLMAHFHDYDRDGDLDMYLLTNRLYRKGGLPTGDATKSVNGVPQILPEYEPYYRLEKAGNNRYTVRTVGRSDFLFQNDGSGNFTDVTEKAGISGRHYGLSATWIDYDHDGFTDLYVANDFKDPDRLYRNQGDGTFKDVVQHVVPHTPWFSMGSDAADVNNDGLMDLLVLDMSSTSHYKQKINMGDMATHQVFMDTVEPRQLMRNAMFINSGAGRFMESAHLSGLSSSDWSWAVKLADFDNDGLTDVFITNGMAAEMTNADLARNLSQTRGQEEWDYLKDKPRRIEPNLAFRNRDGLHFEAVSKDWGLDHNGMSYGSAWADFDRDGRLDLVVAHLNEPVSIYRNTAGGNRFLVSLRGSGKNTLGVGAKLTLHAGETTLTRVLNPATGFVSSNDPVVHFGLGKVSQIDKLVIDWPSGKRQTVAGLKPNQYVRIAEASSKAAADAKPSPWFAPHAALKAARHMEKPFDDFAMQPLLPNKLSQLGPGLAIADIEGDGDEDIVVGAARGENPHLHFQDRGRLMWAYFKNAKPDALCEDMAPLLFDADGDGDLDWLVVSGGVEAGKQPELLRDRLYIHTQPGNLVKAPAGTLPDTARSGSVAAAADYDRDGDLDLFIGGRVKPGEYPLSPGSALWRNDSQGSNKPKFTDTKSAAFAGLGMVTSALWSDVNNDGWVDLLVTLEWGPVKTYINHEGTLKDTTQASGIAGDLGWWNGIAAGDLDHDGDMDYVVTNFGHNTKYHPSVKSPSRIYYGTFGEDPTPQIIEAKLKDGTLLPVRGKSCSQNAMPFLREKYATYHAFASATLPEIYTGTSLDRSVMLEVNTLDSSILINDGEGRFTRRALPALAQMAPGFGVVVTEVNGDGHPDIYLAQNFHTPQRETGKMAGGLSCLLLGDGEGGFSAVWPNQSGLIVPGDAKGLATADFNDDGWADFALSVNNAPLQVFENQRRITGKNQPLTITLRGKPGNPSAIGARITVALSEGPTQSKEVHAGGSYLSQSSAECFFGLPDGATWKGITVRWPDGKTTNHQRSAQSTNRVVLSQE